MTNQDLLEIIPQAMKGVTVADADAVACGVEGIAQRIRCCPRARQNVIIELGFFIGKCGRDKVCSLVVDNLEAPSDCDGVVYVEFDKFESWKTHFFRELKTVDSILMRTK